MKNIKYQQDAILEVVEKSKRLLNNDFSGPKKIIFKAPTGSGKTHMMIDSINRLSKIDNFSFIWISFNSDNSEQSANKFESSSLNNLNVVRHSELPIDSISTNSIFFLNWQKISTSNKGNKKLRKPSEKYPLGMFEQIINNTKKMNKIIFVVDEAHIAAETYNAKQIMELVEADLTFLVTATPTFLPSIMEQGEGSAELVNIKRKDVVKEEMLKKSVVLQTADELNSKGSDENIQEVLIRISIEKLESLKHKWEEEKEDVNPLLLVQLPPEKKTSVDSEMLIAKIKESIISNSIKEDEIAIWMTNEHINLKNIEKNNSKIKVLIFKVAAATGWDAPRASILLMLRDTKSKILYDQTLGRIMRTPIAKFAKNDEINKAYLYTNYSKGELVESFKKQLEINLKMESTIKQGIAQVEFSSSTMKRLEYNDIKTDFIDSLKKEDMNSFIIGGEMEKTSVISDIEVSDIDSIIKYAPANQTSISYLDYEISNKLDELILGFLKNLPEEVKFAELRSLPRLRNVLIGFMKKHSKQNREEVIKVLVNSFKSNNFLIMLREKISEYKLKENSVIKSTDDINHIKIMLPLKTRFYTDKHTRNRYLKSADEYVFLNEDLRGFQNEKRFIEEILEKDKNIVWWWKNSDYGSEYLGIPYIDFKGKRRLFYPDFIIKTQNSIYIIDTKKGTTYDEGAQKLAALKKYSEENGFKFGFAVRDDNTKLWHNSTTILPNPFLANIIKFT
ncbi:MAG: DEAD/DEAH box helicase family protein [Mycoplasmataceae bacterium]|nr:DEAD/DEAH box helicase family protein [Mycoplasmataceae bacterium]